MCIIGAALKCAPIMEWEFVLASELNLFSRLKILQDLWPTLRV